MFELTEYITYRRNICGVLPVVSRYRVRMKAFVCFAAFLAVASAASCPKLSPVAPFTVSDFMGTWYQQYSINTFIFQGAGHCAKVEYTLNADTGIIDTVNTERTMFGGLSTVEGSATLADPSLGDGRLICSQETIFGEKAKEYDILATDYKNYAVLWSCTDVATIPYESAWVYTRVEELTDEVEQLIEAALQDVAAHGGPRTDLWKPTSQKNCF